MKPLDSCPGCGSGELTTGFVLRNQPAVLNYRFATPSAAGRVPRGDVTLAQCGRCRLIFNATLDPALIQYDENYENRQCFSPMFQGYLQDLAAGVVSRNRLEHGRILEVGCGKGDFLRLLCQHTQATGVGYDTSFEGNLVDLGGRVQFHRRYVAANDIRERFDAVICRHVIEHIPSIGRFLSELRAIAEAAGDPVVVLETPSFEWIQEQGSFWDIFYEHCNYFSLPCLAYLAQRAGFLVARHSLVFGRQYQLLELHRAQTPSLEWSPPEASPSADLARFANCFESARHQLEGKLLKAGAESGWAVWGAGAKGVAIVNQLTIQPPRFVIDSNPAKHGCVIPGSQVTVVAPADPRVLKIPVILVVNPNYLPEIRDDLAARGFRNTLLST